MAIDWDDAKRLTNLAKHGVDFADVARFDWPSAHIEPSWSSNEPRLVATGSIDGRVHVLVYSIENRALRVISLRRANRREIRRWQSRP